MSRLPDRAGHRLQDPRPAQWSLPYAVLIWYTQSKNDRKRQLLYLHHCPPLRSRLLFTRISRIRNILFTYYEHFPSPASQRISKKGVLGVWGVPGSIAVKE